MWKKQIYEGEINYLQGARTFNKPSNIRIHWHLAIPFVEQTSLTISGKHFIQ